MFWCDLIAISLIYDYIMKSDAFLEIVMTNKGTSSEIFCFDIAYFR